LWYTNLSFFLYALLRICLAATATGHFISTRVKATQHYRGS